MTHASSTEQPSHRLHGEWARWLLVPAKTDEGYLAELEDTARGFAVARRDDPALSPAEIQAQAAASWAEVPRGDGRHSSRRRAQEHGADAEHRARCDGLMRVIAAAGGDARPQRVAR